MANEWRIIEKTRHIPTNINKYLDGICQMTNSRANCQFTMIYYYLIKYLTVSEPADIRSHCFAFHFLNYTNVGI